jgi:hypothetical protein
MPRGRKKTDTEIFLEDYKFQISILIARLGTEGIPWHCHECHKQLKESDVALTDDWTALIPIHEREGFVYCCRCDNTRLLPYSLPDRSYHHNNNPWGDNAMRALEGD